MRQYSNIGEKILDKNLPKFGNLGRIGIRRQSHVLSGGTNDLSVADVLLEPDGTRVAAYFNAATSPDTDYTLTVSGLRDLHGNASPVYLVTFRWWIVPQGQLIESRAAKVQLFFNVSPR